MEKILKKVLAVVASIAMVLTLACVTPVKAEGLYTIIINNNTEGHTYKAYQVFKGDLSGTTLSNIEWGKDVSDAGKTALGDAQKKAATLQDASDVDTLAKEVYQYLNTNSGTATNVVEGKYTIGNLESGYYLIEDSLAPDGDTYSKYIVKVVGNVDVKPKSSLPTFEKKIKDMNDTTGEETDWQDSADYDIGDKVPFQLKGTVAKNYDDYSTYYFAFHDKQEKGLTFEPGSVKVYVDNVQITTGYKVELSATDGCTFEVIFNNLKDITNVHSDSVITVEYESTLNENAILGNQGNENTAKLEFSNNPNSEQSGKPTTNTTWDNVIVFTYKVVVNKVDEENQPLADAEFTLEKLLSDGNHKEITTIKGGEGTVFTFKGLDDGKYRLIETKAPDGYNKIDPIEFEVKATHKDVWINGDGTTVLTYLSGNVVTGEITFESSVTEGSLTGSVINKPGSNLPDTGGIGNYVFYAGGLLLMAGAGYYFVMKRKEGNV